MKTITATVQAFLSDLHNQDVILSKCPVSIVSALIFWDPHGADIPGGWVHVGSATITVTMQDDNYICSAQIGVIEDAKKRLMADTQMKLNVLDERISKLRALEYQETQT